MFTALQGVKRVSKVLCGAGKELQRIVLDHLQVQVLLSCTLCGKQFGTEFNPNNTLLLR